MNRFFTSPKELGLQIKQSRIRSLCKKATLDKNKPYHNYNSKDWIKIHATQYLHQHDRFPGKIKQHFEHWEVREISKDGEVATLRKRKTRNSNRNARPVIIEKEHPVLRLRKSLGEEDIQKCTDLLNSTLADGLEVSLKFSCVQDMYPVRGALMELYKDTGIVVLNSREELNCRWDDRFFTVEDLTSTAIAKHIFNYLREGRKSKADLLQNIGSDEETRDEILTKLQELFPFLDLRVGLVPQSVSIGWSRKHQKEADSTKVLRFIMEKYNRESLAVFKKFEHWLGTKVKYSGIKDKYGITYQFCTVEGKTEREIRQAAQHIYGIEVGHFVQVDTLLTKRDHRGNWFTVRVKDLNGAQSDVEASLENLQNYGFINYFGPQRFGLGAGKFEVWDAAIALLRGDYETAFRIYETPLLDDIRTTEQAKEYFFDTYDIDGTLERINAWDRIYQAVFTALKTHGLNQEGYRQAFLAYPTAQRSLLLNSYTSLLFNMAVSDRVKRECGGRLIARNGDFKRIEGESFPNDFALVDNEYSAAHQDLVLFTPGSSLIGHEEATQIYREFLDAKNLTMENFLTENRLACAVPGYTRKVVEMPNQLSWKWEQCDDTGETDLILRFWLSKGTFATSLLRELLTFE